MFSMTRKIFFMAISNLSLTNTSESIKISYIWQIDHDFGSAFHMRKK